MATRTALLIAALVLGGCLKAQSTVAREKGCRSCHEAHDVREGACQDCPRGNPGAERVDLARSLRRQLDMLGFIAFGIGIRLARPGLPAFVFRFLPQRR